MRVCRVTPTECRNYEPAPTSVVSSHQCNGATGTADYNGGGLTRVSGLAMSTSHSHIHAHDSTGGLRLAFVLNTVFAVLEIFGGLWTNSVAILSDAVHDLGDSVALGAAWFLEGYARKGGDRRFSYGYRRFSLLGAWTNTTVLRVVNLGSSCVTEAIPRLGTRAAQRRGPRMLLFAGDSSEWSVTPISRRIDSWRRAAAGTSRSTRAASHHGLLVW